MAKQKDAEEIRIPAGMLVILSTGEYSDYQPILVGRARQEIDVASLYAEWLGMHPEQNEKYCFAKWQFLKWLVVDRNLIEELDKFEWNIGAYSSPDNWWVTQDLAQQQRAEIEQAAVGEQAESLTDDQESRVSAYVASGISRHEAIIRVLEEELEQQNATP